MTKAPSLAVDDGRSDRDSRGRFVRGNRSGRGNPMARRAQRLRTALMRAVEPSDIRDVIGRLVELAREGDVQAAKLVLDRTLGPPVAHDLEERLETLERVLGDYDEARCTAQEARAKRLRAR